jgi:hypothetical protein
MTLDTTSTYFQNYMKERWLMPNALMQALYVKAPWLGMVETDTTAGGRFYRTPILQRGPVGRSHGYSNAVANADGSRTEAFEVTYVNNYQIGKLTGDVIRRTKGQENAIEEAIDHEVEGCMVSMRKDLRRGIYGNTGGSRGVVGSESTTTLTLADKADTVNFETGMKIAASSTDGTSGALRDSGDTVTIVGVDRSLGTLTGSTAWATTISGLVAGDYLFEDGDFGADMAGLSGWVPQTAPGATAWYGVDRTSDDRLSGLRFDGTGQPLEDAIIEASGLCYQYDANTDLAIVDPLKWAEVAKSLGSDRGNRVVTKSSSDGYVGYSAIMVATQEGMIPLISDPGCQKDTCYMLDTSTWVLATVGEVVQIIDDDGLLIRRGTSDDWQFEILFSGNLCCRAPGRNLNLKHA